MFIDFQKELANAYRDQVPNVIITGHLFRSKKVSKSKLEEFRISMLQIDAAISSNIMRILTIGPKAEVCSKRVPCENKVIDSSMLVNEWDIKKYHGVESQCSSDLVNERKKIWDLCLHTFVNFSVLVIIL